MFKLAMIQMRVEGGERERNLEHGLELVAEAAACGAEVVVLPETFTLGWTHPSAIREAEPIPDGPSSRRLSSAARGLGVYLCAGLVERAGDSVYNAAVLFGPDGAVCLHHRKLNELEIGQDLYGQGDRLQVAATPLGTFGVMICADAFARGQVVSRTLGLMGAQVILSPCAWAVPSDHDPVREPYAPFWLEHYVPVARDFQMYLAGVSNVGWLRAGPWAGRRCIGCSLLVGPAGEVVAEGPYGVEAETILYSVVEPIPRPVRGTAWETRWSGR